MRRMRLISEAFAEIKEADPNTAITMTGFRRLVLDERIPSIMIGNKRLVSMEDVEHFFQYGDTKQEAARETGKIRPVAI
ncbi:MAG: hypothetical protein MR278_04775 [Bacteroidales bacterium]|nr:hypothetical protein [Anaerotignum sp.]MCI5679276.1 hypothetical protein [Bacteroidales bacterium]MDY3926148.1 hypothetical protein [Anaerotignum sp.]